MLNAELGKRKGFDHRFGEDFGSSVERKSVRITRNVISPGNFCNTSGFLGPLARDGLQSCEPELRQDWQADRSVRGLHHRFPRFG
jgi:hypothetical protein